MHWTITFFDPRVEAGLLEMAAGFVARFIRYAERMEVYGPDLGMPHTRAMGDGLFELRLKGPEGIAPSLLLHPVPTTDHDAASLRQEDPEDANQRDRHRPQAYEGSER